MVTANEEPQKPEDAEASDLPPDVFPFGPAFFVRHLGGFIRERCPEPGALPLVHVTLANGCVLDLCHVIALSPRWIAFAVHDGRVSQEHPVMRTELVPYAHIVRVTIREPGDERHVGFRQEPSRPRTVEDGFVSKGL